MSHTHTSTGVQTMASDRPDLTVRAATAASAAQVAVHCPSPRPDVSIQPSCVRCGKHAPGSVLSLVSPPCDMRTEKLMHGMAFSTSGSIINMWRSLCSPIVPQKCSLGSGNSSECASCVRVPPVCGVASAHGTRPDFGPPHVPWF
jgi:hypothetical protein